MAALSDKLENTLIDFLLRGQAMTPITGATAAAGTGPATVYVGLFTSATTMTDAGGGTEVSTSGTNYGRLAVASSLTNWKSTQGDSSASTGTSGTTSNSVALNIGASNSIAANGTPTTPTPNVGATGYGTIRYVGVYDAAVGGNLLFYAQLAADKVVNGGDPVPSFAVGQLTFQLDN